jgi:hypothetical protein
MTHLEKAIWSDTYRGSWLFIGLSAISRAAICHQLSTISHSAISH